MHLRIFLCCRTPNKYQWKIACERQETRASIAFVSTRSNSIASSSNECRSDYCIYIRNENKAIHTASGFISRIEFNWNCFILIYQFLGSSTHNRYALAYHKLGIGTAHRLKRSFRARLTATRVRTYTTNKRRQWQEEYTMFRSSNTYLRERHEWAKCRHRTAKTPKHVHPLNQSDALLDRR